MPTPIPAAGISLQVVIAIPKFPEFCYSRNVRIFREIIPEILENLNCNKFNAEYQRSLEDFT